MTRRARITLQSRVGAACFRPRPSCAPTGEQVRPSRPWFGAPHAAPCRFLLARFSPLPSGTLVTQARPAEDGGAVYRVAAGPLCPLALGRPLRCPPSVWRSPGTPAHRAAAIASLDSHKAPLHLAKPGVVAWLRCDFPRQQRGTDCLNWYTDKLMPTRSTLLVGQTARAKLLDSRSIPATSAYLLVRRCCFDIVGSVYEFSQNPHPLGAALPATEQRHPPSLAGEQAPTHRFGAGLRGVKETT
jgi:hypothetical protein